VRQLQAFIVPQLFEEKFSVKRPYIRFLIGIDFIISLEKAITPVYQKYKNYYFDLY
jgi:hypothetical protein